MARTPRISIVDDDSSVRESLRRLFRSLGFGVEAFSSAEDFLGSHRPSETDCIILDVRMPGMSGFELHRRLLTSHPRVPVVFITAHGDEEQRSQALEAGAVDYLLKPFSEEALLNAVDTALSGSDVK